MNIFRENIALKIISVVLALFLWLIVVNVSKPEIQASTTVEIEVLNQEAFEADSKVWEVDRTSVSISYTVRTDQRSGISASDFRAYIDLKDYSITGSVPVYVEVLNGKGNVIRDVSPRPTVVHVSIEDVQEKKFDIAVNTIGMQAEGYDIAAVLISPETVYAIGPKSSIGRISAVGIEVDVNGFTESMSGTTTPKFYDANGNVIRDVGDVLLSSPDVEYSVTVHKKKSINLLSSIKGIPAIGYQYEGTTVSPASVQLSASNAVINGMTVLELPAIDITGATGNITKSFRIEDYLPAGVSLAEANEDATVTIRIEKLPETVRATREEESSSFGAPGASESETEPGGERYGTETETEGTLPAESASEAEADASQE